VRKVAKTCIVSREKCMASSNATWYIAPEPDASAHKQAMTEPTPERTLPAAMLLLCAVVFICPWT
jgi:hypothetical protein